MTNNEIKRDQLCICLHGLQGNANACDKRLFTFDIKNTLKLNEKWQ